MSYFLERYKSAINWSIWPHCHVCPRRRWLRNYAPQSTLPYPPAASRPCSSCTIQRGCLPHQLTGRRLPNASLTQLAVAWSVGQWISGTFSDTAVETPHRQHRPYRPLWSHNVKTSSRSVGSFLGGRCRSAAQYKEANLESDLAVLIAYIPHVYSCVLMRSMMAMNIRRPILDIHCVPRILAMINCCHACRWKTSSTYVRGSNIWEWVHGSCVRNSYIIK